MPALRRARPSCELAPSPQSGGRPEHGRNPEAPRLTEVYAPQSEASIAAGRRMHGWLQDLFPICRSITGPGLRETLAYLQRLLPGMKIHAVPSGTPAFDWAVPDEWTIRQAWIEHEDGTRVVDFANHN